MMWMRPRYTLGLDVGQRHDYSALCVAEGRETSAGGMAYTITHLARWRDLPYTELPERIRTVVRQIEQVEADAYFAGHGHLGPGNRGYLPHLELVVDQTGVGVAVVDLLREAEILPVAVTIHGGDSVSQPKPDEYRVPKRDLAGVVQVLLQSKRLQIIDSLPLAGVLRDELGNFRAKISLSGHDSYGAGEDWRQGNHDDLILAVALAVWYGERQNWPARSRSQALLDEVMRRQFG